MKACTVCANAQASVLRSSGHSVTEIAKLLNKCERYKWTGVQKWMAVFFWFKCVKKCYRKSCKHMRNNSTRQKGKKNSTSQFQSFEHNGMKIYDQQRLESRE